MRFSPGEINIICTSLEASQHFYCDILGFEKISEEDRAVHLKCEGRQYLLLPVAPKKSPHENYCAQAEFSMDLMVANVEAAAQYLHENGVKFIRDWQPEAKSVFIRDPDGLVWEIIQQRK